MAMTKEDKSKIKSLQGILGDSSIDMLDSKHYVHK